MERSEAHGRGGRGRGRGGGHGTERRGVTRRDRNEGGGLEGGREGETEREAGDREPHHLGTLERVPRDTAPERYRGDAPLRGPGACPRPVGAVTSADRAGEDMSPAPVGSRPPTPGPHGQCCSVRTGDIGMGGGKREEGMEGLENHGRAGPDGDNGTGHGPRACLNALISHFSRKHY